MLDLLAATRALAGAIGTEPIRKAAFEHQSDTTCPYPHAGDLGACPVIASYLARDGRILATLAAEAERKDAIVAHEQVFRRELEETRRASIERARREGRLR